MYDLSVTKLYMEILEAWKDIRECGNMEGKFVNHGNRNNA